MYINWKDYGIGKNVWTPYRKSDIETLVKVQKRQLKYYLKIGI